MQVQSSEPGRTGSQAYLACPWACERGLRLVPHAEGWQLQFSIHQCTDSSPGLPHPMSLYNRPMAPEEGPRGFKVRETLVLCDSPGSRMPSWLVCWAHTFQTQHPAQRRTCYIDHVARLDYLVNEISELSNYTPLPRHRHQVQAFALSTRRLRQS